MKNITFFLLLLSLICAQPSRAIREGTANATIFIRQYEQRGEWDKVALWHEAAAECLTRISIPMNEIAHTYYARHKHEKWVARAKKERAEIQAQRQFHLKRAEAAWKKSGFLSFARRSDRQNGAMTCLCVTRKTRCVFLHKTCCDTRATAQSCLQAERERIVSFMAIWAPHYPNRFYDFGIYPTFFREQRERAEQKKDYVKVLQLEADAAEMCATQYEKIPITIGLKRYEKVRDAYRQHAMLLRALAEQNPKTLPSEADRGKQIVDAYTPRDDVRAISSTRVLQLAKSNARVKEALGNENGIHEYVWFQGFAWTVSFYNHSWGNLAIAIIDDKTGKVVDVLTQGGSLEN